MAGTLGVSRSGQSTKGADVLGALGANVVGRSTLDVTVMEAPTSFSLFSPTDCTLYSHFSFNDFVMIAFPDLTGDLDDLI